MNTNVLVNYKTFIAHHDLAVSIASNDENLLHGLRVNLICILFFFDIYFILVELRIKKYTPMNGHFFFKKAVRSCFKLYKSAPCNL